MRRIFGPLAIAIALASMTAGGIVIAQPDEAPASGTAHFWIDANGGSCVDNPIAIEYPNDGTECSTMQAVLNAAECGDIALIRPNDYPAQTINRTASCSVGTYITFSAEEGVADGDVTFDDISWNASDVYLKDAGTPNNTIVIRQDDNWVLDNVDNGGFFFESTSDGEIKNSEVVCPNANNACGYHPQVSAMYCEPSCNATHHDPQRLRIVNNDFHGWQSANAAGGQHTECLQIGGGDGAGDTTPGAGVLIMNNTLNECCHLNLGGGTGCTAGIHLTDYALGSGHETSEVAFVNNQIGPDIGNASVQFGEYDNSGFFFNSTVGGIIDVCGSCTGSPMYFVGNNTDYIPGICSGSITYRYNNWDGGTCHATDSNSPNLFIDSAGTDFNLRLSSGSGGPNNLVPTSAPGLPGCPATDIDGDTRPAQTNCDAGIDERT